MAAYLKLETRPRVVPLRYHILLIVQVKNHDMLDPDVIFTAYHFAGG